MGIWPQEYWVKIQSSPFWSSCTLETRIWRQMIWKIVYNIYNSSIHLDLKQNSNLRMKDQVAQKCGFDNQCSDLGWLDLAKPWSSVKPNIRGRPGYKTEILNYLWKSPLRDRNQLWDLDFLVLVCIEKGKVIVTVSGTYIFWDVFALRKGKWL